MTGKVTHGAKLGRTLGYPTVNLENPSVMNGFKKGVYAARVKIGNKFFNSALYYGPKYILDKPKLVIEIFLFDYTGDLYDMAILFLPVAFIRSPVKVKNLEELAALINKDCKEIRSLLQYHHTPTYPPASQAWACSSVAGGAQ